MSLFRCFLTASVVALAVSGGAAAAATLSVFGGKPLIVPKSFNPAPATGIMPGEVFTNFTGAFTGGLLVDGPTRVRFTLLGNETDYSNVAIGGAASAMLQDDTVGSFLEFVQASAGLVSLKFATDGAGGDSITNGSGGTHPSLDLAFGAVFNGGRSVYALFGDGGGGNDDDYDDMVIRIDVSPVPVPAAGLLLLTALGGAAALRRRKTA